MTVTQEPTVTSLTVPLVWLRKVVDDFQVTVVWLS